MLEKIVGLCLENIKIEMEIKLDDEEWKLMWTHRPYTVHTHFSFRNPYPFINFSHHQHKIFLITPVNEQKD